VGAGALWRLVRSPGTQVQLDLTQRQLWVVKSGLFGRRVRTFGFQELERLEIEEGTASEGGRVWRPALRLRSGELLLLSELWSHDQTAMDEAVAVVAQACRLPSPRHGRGIGRGAVQA
jgi:hypothetical protein